MTIFPIDYYTDAEKSALLQQISKEEKKAACFHENYDLANNWEKWEKIKSRFPMKRYLLFKKEFSNAEKHALIYFIDILQLAIILQKHYELFHRTTGMDFHPLEIVFEMEHDSEFWDKVFDQTADHAALIGILFGYGLKNAFCFQWKWWGPPSLKGFTKTLYSQFSDHPQTGHATLRHLSLPVFASFITPDEMIKKYKKERKKIQKTYQGRNFVDLTLAKLTENSFF